MADNPPLTALVFSGGLGLGAYHGGAFEAFTCLSYPVNWLAGSSAGAISAALIAGSAPGDRVLNLRNYWRAPDGLAAAPSSDRHVLAWMHAINTHVFGHPGFFLPRLPMPAPHFDGLYNLAPTRERLQRLIDFGRLNDGDPRVTICATNLESGDAVLFDSASGPIEMDHILASCGFLQIIFPLQYQFLIPQRSILVVIQNQPAIFVHPCLKSGSLETHKRQQGIYKWLVGSFIFN